MRPYRDSALSLARSLGVPIACSWGSIDLINHDDPLNVGAFGTHGTRAANFAVQNADLLIVLGCRLDTKSTGSPPHFARAAKIVMVDIDRAEIDKFEKLGRPIEVGLCQNVGDFIRDYPNVLSFNRFPERHKWQQQIANWKKLYRPQGKPYDLMRQIAEYTNEKDIIVSDTGNTLGWIMQGFPFKGERFVHAFNFTPMGYGLGAAIGAACASGRRVICIVGDGGALSSVNELATIARHRLNIKVILLDNKGHGICRHTQRMWLGGTYPATSIEGGLGMPKSWWDVAESFGFPTVYFDEYKDSLGAMLGPDFDTYSSGYYEGPDFRVVEIDENAEMAFQTRFGFPIEDMEPLLSREEMKEQMLIPMVTA